jgi:8-oxo-dGTP diphosphatase
MPETYADLLARNLRAARAAANLSQADAGERMRALGFRSWLGQTVSASERGKRRVTAEEIIGLCAALECPPGALLLPVRGSADIELPAGQLVRLGRDAHEITLPTGRRPDGTPLPHAWDGNVPNLISAKQPVVAAVVTSRRSVLVGRRVDGQPPWTFIAGEVEPGERPEDAAVREVKEETGVEIRAGKVIGERDHPATGRHMIYMAATPARATRLIVGDEAELAEVRWASLAEAAALMPDMFGPVREYLAREIGEGRA